MVVVAWGILLRGEGGCRLDSGRRDGGRRG